MSEKDSDVGFAISIAIPIFTLFVSLILKYLGIISFVFVIIINLIGILFPILYWIFKKLNPKEITPEIKKRPELEDIMSPLEALEYVKKYFQDNFAILLNMEHDDAYQTLKTVGSENYETKIYMFYMMEGKKQIFYHIVMQGHDPQGCLFLKNETNLEKIKELQEGMAIKSQLFKTEVIIHKDELSGNKITKKTTSPVDEVGKDDKDEE